MVSNVLSWVKITHNTVYIKNGYVRSQLLLKNEKNYMEDKNGQRALNFS